LLGQKERKRKKKEKRTSDHLSSKRVIVAIAVAVCREKGGKGKDVILYGKREEKSCFSVSSFQENDSSTRKICWISRKGKKTAAAPYCLAWKERRKEGDIARFGKKSDRAMG